LAQVVKPVPAQEANFPIVGGLHNAPETVSQLEPFKETSVAESLSPKVEYKSRTSEFSLDEVDTTRLVAENGTLRQQVARLQSEKEALQERLRQESALKDRYFSELCICHEQLQRHRSTPR
jgi:hypothetical protein